jgi:hypothetical protein
MLEDSIILPYSVTRPEINGQPYSTSNLLLSLAEDPSNNFKPTEMPRGMNNNNNYNNTEGPISSPSPQSKLLNTSQNYQETNLNSSSKFSQTNKNNNNNHNNTTTSKFRTPAAPATTAAANRTSYPTTDANTINLDPMNLTTSSMAPLLTSNIKLYPSPPPPPTKNVTPPTKTTTKTTTPVTTSQREKELKKKEEIFSKTVKSNINKEKMDINTLLQITEKYSHFHLVNFAEKKVEQLGPQVKYVKPNFIFSESAIFNELEAQVYLYYPNILNYTINFFSFLFFSFLFFSYYHPHPLFNFTFRHCIILCHFSPSPQFVIYYSRL